jgi:hypothetical protein
VALRFTFAFPFPSFGPLRILRLTLLFAFYLLGLVLRWRDWGSTTFYTSLGWLLSHCWRSWLLNTLFRTRDFYPVRLSSCAWRLRRSRFLLGSLHCSCCDALTLWSLLRRFSSTLGLRVSHSLVDSLLVVLLSPLLLPHSSQLTLVAAALCSIRNPNLTIKNLIRSLRRLRYRFSLPLVLHLELLTLDLFGNGLHAH